MNSLELNDRAHLPRGRQSGMLEMGNINLHNNPIVKNPNGTVSTVRSISIGEDGRSTLIPTVVNGRVVNNKTAIKQYQHTGKHLGQFITAKQADYYAQTLHRQEARRVTEPTFPHLDFNAALNALRQQFPHLGAPKDPKASPQMKKIQAIIAAKQHAAEHTQELQHARRFNGPYR